MFQVLYHMSGGPCVFCLYFTSSMAGGGIVTSGLYPRELGVWLRPLMRCLLNWPFVQTLDRSHRMIISKLHSLPDRLQEASSCHVPGVTGQLGTCVVDQKAACRASVFPGHHGETVSLNFSEQCSFLPLSVMQNVSDPFQVPTHLLKHSPVYWLQSCEPLKLCIFRQPQDLAPVCVQPRTRSILRRETGPRGRDRPN